MKHALLSILFLPTLLHAEGPVSLFNGKDLAGWKADVPAADKDPNIAPSFIVRDGMLVSMGKPGGHLVTEKVYSNYKLTVEYRFAHEGGILNLALSGDGRLLASTATDKTLKLWNASDLTERRLLEKQPDWSSALAFTDRSRLVAGRIDGTLGVYEP